MPMVVPAAQWQRHPDDRQALTARLGAVGRRLALHQRLAGRQDHRRPRARLRKGEQRHGGEPGEVPPVVHRWGMGGTRPRRDGRRHQPGHREDHRQGCRRRQAGHRACGERGAEGLRRGLVRHTAQRAQHDAPQAGRRHRRRCSRARPARVHRCRQADYGLQGGHPVRIRQPALFCRCRPLPGRQVHRRVREGLHQHDPSGALGRHRRYLPLELPADDGHLEARPCLGGRQYLDHQAGADHSSYHASGGRLGCGHLSRRSLQRRDR